MLTIDIEKAYDTVPFALIQHMLTQYNCPPQTLKLIMEMHTKRALRFKIEGHIGLPIKPQRGVAQGSPLSCILFVLCMQPLLKRLQTTGSGLWGLKDDVAYVDDLTLLAPTASDLEQKWGVVREFEQWSGMRINIAKCEYDTTEVDPEKWATLPGVKNMRAQEKDANAVRVLGFWLNASGDREDQIQKIVTSIRIATHHMKRKLISPAIAKGIINMILSARLNYTAQNNEIPLAAQKQIKDACQTLAKQQYGFAQPSITAKLFAHPTEGGMGLENPQNVADRATVAEYVLALNSEKEQYTAEIMRDNIKRIDDMAHAIKPISRRTASTNHTPRCLQHQKQGGECTCRQLTYQDMQYAQAGRSAARLGLTIQATAVYDTAVRALVKARERAVHNGKQRIQPGEYLYLKHKRTGDERCAVFYTNVSTETGTHLGLTWLPKLEYVQTVQKRTTIVGDNAHCEKNGIPLERSYITARALEQAYARKTIKPSEILRRLTQQWTAETQITTLRQIPGITTTWVEDPDEWHIHRAHMSMASLSVSRRTKGQQKKWAIDIRVLENIEEAEIDITGNPAYNAKQQLKTLLREETGEHIEAWTDGSKKGANDTARFGCGIHVETQTHGNWDLACKITGVGSVLGAELTPIIKLLKWCNPCTTLTIHTDSQAAIDVWRRMQSTGYSDR